MPSSMEITTDKQLADLKRRDIIHINMDEIEDHSQSGIPISMIASSKPCKYFPSKIVNM